MLILCCLPSIDIGFAGKFGSLYLLISFGAPSAMYWEAQTRPQQQNISLADLPSSVEEEKML